MNDNAPNNMVERMAKAHYGALHYTSWDALTLSDKATLIAAMRMALGKARTPTPRMLSAGRMYDTTDTLTNYQAMVDEALAEK